MTQTVAGRIEHIATTVRSPDEYIFLSMTGTGALAFSFSPNTYPRYRGPDLETQLAGLMTVAWREYRRGRQAIFDKEFGECLVVDDDPDPAQVRLNEQCAKVSAGFESQSGLIYAETTGLFLWRFEIPTERPAHELTERGFITELRSVTAATIESAQRQIGWLRAQTWDLGLPKRRMEQLHNGLVNSR